MPKFPQKSQGSNWTPPGRIWLFRKAESGSFLNFPTTHLCQFIQLKGICQKRPEVSKVRRFHSHLSSPPSSRAGCLGHLYLQPGFNFHYFTCSRTQKLAKDQDQTENRGILFLLLKNLLANRSHDLRKDSKFSLVGPVWVAEVTGWTEMEAQQPGRKAALENKVRMEPHETWDCCNRKPAMPCSWGTASTRAH